MYCPQCRRLIDTSKCPYCRKWNVREPEAQDPCLVYAGSQIWADMAADVLGQQDIPCFTQSSRGAAIAMLTGLMSEEYEVYVPYAVYDQAKEIVEQLFSAENIVTDEEDEATEGEKEDEEDE